MILTLDFDTWFWCLILMDEFDDKLVSQMDVQMDVRTTLTLESLHDWKTHFHFSRFYLLNKIIRFFTYTLILTATRATSEITKIFLQDTFLIFETWKQLDNLREAFKNDLQKHMDPPLTYGKSAIFFTSLEWFLGN